MKYLNTTTMHEVEIDVLKASLEDVNAAYQSLADRSGSSAFPGSSAWLKAKKFSDAAAGIMTARPELAEYRQQMAAAARAARLAGKDVLGM